MSFIEMPGMDDAKEPVVGPEALYDLVIANATLKEKDGKKNILVILEIEGAAPDGGKYANVMHNISLAGPDDDPEKRAFKALMQKRFFHQFSVPTDGGVDLEQMPGCRAHQAKLTVDTWEGTKKNVLKLDPLPTEEE